MIWKNKQLIELAKMLIFCGMLQSAAWGAEEACQGIGGTGKTISGECGIGGTGNTISKSGIGGTGHATEEKESTANGVIAKEAGIGGTGHVGGEGGIGGTGIVGIITGFGSVWVNGLEVQYDAKTEIGGNGSTTSSDLAIGQVVVIEAKEKNKELHANKISAINAVAGAVSKVDTNNGKFEVLGQTVMTNVKTVFPDKQGLLLPKAGDQVKVSGLRMANGEIVATRIEHATQKIEPMIVGPVTAINGNLIEIYGLHIAVTTSKAMNVGTEISIQGELSGGVLIARNVHSSPASDLFGKTEQVNLQGYLEASSKDGQLKMGNIEIVVADSAKGSEKIKAGELVQIMGRYASDHKVLVDRIEISRERPEAMGHERVSDRENNRSEKTEHNEVGNRVEHQHHLDHIERPDRPDRSDHSDMQNHSEHAH